MSRHSFSARRRPTASTPIPAIAPRTGSPFPQTRCPTQATVLNDLSDADIEKDSRSLGRHGVIRDLAIIKLAPREIEIRIGQLIHASLNGRSTAMATAIVRHLEALCVHPDDRRSPEERCILWRLAGHWRRLAWIAVDSESGGSAIRSVPVRRPPGR